jgi:hypothetical protein
MPAFLASVVMCFVSLTESKGRVRDRIPESPEYFTPLAFAGRSGFQASSGSLALAALGTNP